jgi:hypothetical protein
MPAAIGTPSEINDFMLREHTISFTEADRKL